jgi:hypothetical protein
MLPNEIIFRIMDFLSPIHTINLGKTNSRFRKLTRLKFVNLLKNKLNILGINPDILNKDCMLTGGFLLELLLNGELRGIKSTLSANAFSVKCIDLRVNKDFFVTLSNFLIKNGYSIIYNIFVKKNSTQINIISKNRFSILDNYFDGHSLYYSSYLISNLVQIIDMDSVLKIHSRLYYELKFDIIHYQKLGFKFQFKYMNKIYNNIVFGNGKGIKIF